jgi:hypothetical protein
MKRKACLIFIISLFNLFNASAQIVTAFARMDSNKIVLGEQVKLNLELRLPADNKDKINIQWPALNDTITSVIEIVEGGKIDTILSPDNTTVLYKQTLTITAFDTGYHVIPPIKFYRDSINFSETQALLIYCKGVQLDGTEQFKDIKGPLDAPITFEEILPYLLMVLGAIALILFGIWWYKKRKKTPKSLEIIPNEMPQIEAHELAINKLEALKNKRLWQLGETKAYHSEISEIVREYLEIKYGFQALESTTYDILKISKNIIVSPSNFSKLKSILELTDLVKFAKYQALPTENELIWQQAYDFIKQDYFDSQSKKEEGSNG